MNERAIALALHLNGKTYTEISDIVGVDEATLSRWSQKYGWDEKRKQHMELLETKAIEDITDFKVRMIKQLESLRDMLFEDVKLCKNPTKDKVIGEIVNINKQILLLQGLPTEISKTESKVEVKPMKLEDYFK